MLYRKLKVIMHDRGYTYDDLSRLSGVPLATLTKIGSGVTLNPGFETMERIARTLRCSLDEFSEAEPMVPYGYESYVGRGLQLPSNMREYIRFLIDIEFDRMTYLRSHDYQKVKCFEFTTFALRPLRADAGNMPAGLLQMLPLRKRLRHAYARLASASIRICGGRSFPAARSWGFIMTIRTSPDRGRYGRCSVRVWSRLDGFTGRMMDLCCAPSAIKEGTSSGLRRTRSRAWENSSAF